VGILHRVIAIFGWKYACRGRGEAPEGHRSKPLFDEKGRIDVDSINRLCIFANTCYNR